MVLSIIGRLAGKFHIEVINNLLTGYLQDIILSPNLA